MSLDNVLKEYVITYIIPQYQAFDNGHNVNHVNDVIENSLAIAEDFDVDIDMVFTVAAYHDVGIKFGRENHNITSAKILTEDKFIAELFSKDQIITIKEAIEDHRASNNYEPRSIYGKIISEADRIIDAEKIIYRTIEYGRSNFPNLSDEEQYERTYEHIKDKYGENGYIKLWLNTERNVRGLEKIRALLKDKKAMKNMCESYNK